MRATVSNRTGSEVNYGGVKIPANGRTNIRTSLIKKEEIVQLEKDGFTVIQNGNGDHLLVDAKAEAQKEAKAKAEGEAQIADAFEALKKEATNLGVEFDGRTNFNSLKAKVDKAKEEAKGDS